MEAGHHPMRALPSARALAALACVCLAGPAAAQEKAAPQVAAVAEPANELHGRLDAAQVYGADPSTADYLLFTDLRLRADATNLGGAHLSLRLDGRGRKSWNGRAEDRLTPTEAFFKAGDDSDGWRVAAGRQLIRAAASAEVDGLALERKLGDAGSLVLFGGLQPHPLTGAFNLDFRTAGLGYEDRGRNVNSAGGLVLSMFGGQIDRIYLTERATLALGSTLMLAGFAMVDLVSPAGLLALSGAQSDVGNIDLSNGNLMLRWRPVRWYDGALSASHVHTLLPSRWWRDWFAEQQRARGFALDGEEPVGTRLTSLRWTHTLNLSPAFAPYLRLRYDVRHTEAARGYEGKLGLKWRPKIGYLDVSYSYRDYFNALAQLAALRLGLEGKALGFEGGATLLHSRPHSAPAATNSYDLDGVLWLDLGESLGLKGLMLLGQYQVFLEPGSTYHTLFAQLAYRI
jgi:hypothetical protein